MDLQEFLSRFERAAGEPEELLKEALEGVVAAVPCDRAIIFYYLGDQELMVAKALDQAPPAGETYPFSRTIVDKVLDTRSHVMSMDLGQDVDEAVSVAIVGIRSVLCMPILEGDRVAGVIYLDDLVRKAAFGEKEVPLLKAVGAAVVKRLASS